MKVYFETKTIPIFRKAYLFCDLLGTMIIRATHSSRLSRRSRKRRASWLPKAAIHKNFVPTLTVSAQPLKRLGLPFGKPVMWRCMISICIR